MIKPNSSMSDYAHIVSSKTILVKPKEATRGRKAPEEAAGQVRDAIRLKHYSIRTEQAYVGWIKRYILFHDVRHPVEMGAAQVEAFLTHLAVKANVAASTQNQALSALLFLYREVLHQDLGPCATASPPTCWNSVPHALGRFMPFPHPSGKTLLCVNRKRCIPTVLGMPVHDVWLAHDWRRLLLELSLPRSSVGASMWTLCVLFPYTSKCSNVGK
jgi:hypothetical protein